MTDVLTPEQRRLNMSRIRGKDTKPEMALRRALWQRGLRYRVHYKLLGRPDIVFSGKRLAVFIDGCFWHGCPEHGVSPKTNAEFWKSKISGNIDRDQRVTAQLTSDGWRVLRFWEHEIESDIDAVVAAVCKALGVSGDSDHNS